MKIVEQEGIKLSEPIKKEVAKLYVVTEDGYTRGYGAEIFLRGVFTDESKAREIAGGNQCAKITEISADRDYPLGFENGNGSNEFYLGGYCE